MSHFDQVIKPPTGSDVVGSTDAVSVAAFADELKKQYGIMFHPEVQHTTYGQQILENFVLDICGEIPLKTETKIDEIIQSLKKKIGNKKAVCALSGGIDSAVAAVIVNQAIGKNLNCIYVDTGMMRLGETTQIIDTFKKNFHLNLKVVKAEKIFLTFLKGVTDPEKKRKIIGETFIRVFEKESKKVDAQILIQGTIYPDVIESKGTKHAHTIKTHHNVGGIPGVHRFQIVEPLRSFYKDEVRELARQLGFPSELVHRHAFPGPGLAVRIIGEITREKLDILRRADAIVMEEIKKAGLYEKIWMAFAVFTGVKSTGVGGDERKYGETIAVRVIESKDAMTADWVRLPYEVLATISNRITTEVFEVTRVVYDITSKPPGTMEWE
jgi:GMP synthase (glutamine-hydrolysing)